MSTGAPGAPGAPGQNGLNGAPGAPGAPGPAGAPCPHTSTLHEYGLPFVPGDNFPLTPGTLVQQGDVIFPDGNVSNPTPNNVTAPVCVP